MDTKANNRKQWGKTLLATIGIFFASLLVALLIMMQTEPWAQWAWILSCWVSILSFSAIPLFIASYFTGENFPDASRFFAGAPWGIIGGVTAFGLMWIVTQTSCCYKDDMYMLACFGPLLGLMGFFFGSAFRNRFPLFALTIASPFIYGYLQPIIGNQLAAIVFYIIVFGSSGIEIYLRITRGVPGEVSLPTRTIMWQKARCPQCDGSWTLGEMGTENPEHCPTCGWSWKEAGVNPSDVPSFLASESPKRNLKRKWNGL
ncbi:MAG: hypothetical protein H6667_24630 [Ardenticatenaceae bacterium]|nr:hypothetical protein [Ardenticatenaceae bacterium]MCB9444325.1 hypothetical protein [Ardenticatenaceae bacterium]